MTSLLAALLIGTSITPSGVSETTLSPECALAIAASYNEIAKDKLGDSKKQDAWTFVKKNYKVVRCTSQGRFMMVEFLSSNDPLIHGGVITFRIDLEVGEVIEKTKG